MSRPVYVAEYYSHDGGGLLGLFSSMEAARACLQAKIAEDDWPAIAAPPMPLDAAPRVYEDGPERYLVTICGTRYDAYPKAVLDAFVPEPA